MNHSRHQLESILHKLTDAERGSSVLGVVGWFDVLEDAGYVVEFFTVDGCRVYRATDPETGERQQVATVPGAVSDLVAARGVAVLWGVA